MLLRNISFKFLARSVKIIFGGWKNYLLIILCLNLIWLSKSYTQDSSNPLFVDPGMQDFSQNPKLLKRILASPHGYFRFINKQFSRNICQEFEEMYAGSPSLNLHGDAHLEQYAVTDLGRGLTDFDDSSAGPAILDIMRFGVSLNLTCSMNHWNDSFSSLFNLFLEGYRGALENPLLEAPEPALVSKLRSDFTYNKEEYYKWVNSIMDEMPTKELDSLMVSMKTYVDAMMNENPQLSQYYFEVVNLGYLKMGIGSALDQKYLARCQGESNDPLDDVVLEIKEVRDISQIPCLTRAQIFDPFRILIGQARIAYQPFYHLGYFSFREKNFWVHSWVQNYKELDIQESCRDKKDLEEIVYDVGVQLGRGHPKQIAAPLDFQLRQAQLRWLEKYSDELKLACESKADEVKYSWNKFSEKVLTDERGTKSTTDQTGSGSENHTNKLEE